MKAPFSAARRGRRDGGGPTADHSPLRGAPWREDRQASCWARAAAQSPGHPLPPSTASVRLSAAQVCRRLAAPNSPRSPSAALSILSWRQAFSMHTCARQARHRRCSAPPLARRLAPHAAGSPALVPADAGAPRHPGRGSGAGLRALLCSGPPWRRARWCPPTRWGPGPAQRAHQWTPSPAQAEGSHAGRQVGGPASRQLAAPAHRLWCTSTGAGRAAGARQDSGQACRLRRLAARHSCCGFRRGLRMQAVPPCAGGPQRAPAPCSPGGSAPRCGKAAQGFGRQRVSKPPGRLGPAPWQQVWDPRWMGVECPAGRRSSTGRQAGRPAAPPGQHQMQRPSAHPASDAARDIACRSSYGAQRLTAARWSRRIRRSWWQRRRCQHRSAAGAARAGYPPQTAPAPGRPLREPAWMVQRDEEQAQGRCQGPQLAWVIRALAGRNGVQWRSSMTTEPLLWAAAEHGEWQAGQMTLAGQAVLQCSAGRTAKGSGVCSAHAQVRAWWRAHGCAAATSSNRLAWSLQTHLEVGQNGLFLHNCEGRHRQVLLAGAGGGGAHQGGGHRGACGNGKAASLRALGWGSARTGKGCITLRLMNPDTRSQQVLRLNRPTCQAKEHRAPVGSGGVLLARGRAHQLQPLAAASETGGRGLERSHGRRAPGNTERSHSVVQVCRVRAIAGLEADTETRCSRCSGDVK